MIETIDIVLPCFNPRNKWYEELIGFYNYAKSFYKIQFILVNDGSNNSSEIIKQVEEIKKRDIPVNYLAYDKNQGKGYALREGVRASSSSYVLYTDIDFPFTDNSVLNVIHTLVREKCDIVVGYRAENYYKETMSAYRKVLSKTFRFFLKRVLKMAVTDTQCGLKAFNQKGKAKFISTTVNRYLFDFEFVYAAGKDHLLTLRVLEVQLKEGIVFSKMRIKVLVQEIFNLVRLLVFSKS